MRSAASKGAYVCEFIERHCRITKGAHAGQLTRLLPKVPRSPQRLALQWQAFSDATVERRLTHSPDPVMARHVANLSLISGPSGLRPDLDVPEGAPIAAALGAMIAFDGVTRIGPPATLGTIILPTGVG